MKAQIEAFLAHPKTPWLVPLAALLYAISTLLPITQDLIKLTRAHISPAGIAQIEHKPTHPFGTYSQQPDSAPESNLPWTLEGTVASHSKEKDFALIKLPSTATKLFRVNDTISEGVRLLQVFRDRIIIENRGQKETLKLPKPK